MDDFADSMPGQEPTGGEELGEVQGGAAPNTAPEEKQTEKVRLLVQRILATIKSDKDHHKDAFQQMRDDMFMAKYGRPRAWDKSNYKAAIAGRHVKQKTASLYAKNPKASAKRTERLDFVHWDEDPQTLMLAFQTVQTATQMALEHKNAQAMALQANVEAAAAAPPVEGAEHVDPVAGALTIAAPPSIDPSPPPQPPGFEMAQLVLQDFQQGMERRTMYDKVGKTLEILFARALREQKPVTFQVAAKQLVRRTCTTGVGYCELGFQREYGPRPGLAEGLADSKARFDHLERLQNEVASGEITDSSAEMAELEASMAALQEEPEILIREGLIFDFPRSTKVIPDKLCKTLVGFIGARHLAVEYDYTADEVKELFKVDLKNEYSGYTGDGKEATAASQADFFEEDEEAAPVGSGKGMVRVWKYYDKPSGLVYYVADGHTKFLREPAPPDVFVEDFWPVYALTFNEVESEDELFPPSDVFLMSDMQIEHNRSRQGKREHRDAARPRWAYPNSALQPEDRGRISKVKPFDAIGLDIDPATKLADVLQTFPVPGVDPNLYDTNENFADTQLVLGAQQAQMGGLAKATATESAISAGASASTDGSSIDDLDAFLTVLARSGGQILLREMSEEQVKEQVGPGAVWPHLSLAEIAGEVFLEVEAGSTGKPNQAIEIDNWSKMLPHLMQIPGISPVWLAKETLRRLDDRLDLTAAIAAGIPAIVAQNQQQQPTPATPGDAPNAQGPQGANNAPAAHGGPSGTGAAFGSNQV